MVGRLSTGQKIAYFLYFAVLPTTTLLVLTGLPSIVEVAILLASAIGGLAGYAWARNKGSSSMASIAVGLLGVLFASFAAISYMRSPTGNVFNIYSPYYSAIVAWAVPTIMWQEAEWLTQAQVEQQSHSNEENEISNILIESVGLLVALYYTHVLVVLNLVSNGEQLGFRIFLGLFVPWVVYRWYTS